MTVELRERVKALETAFAIAADEIKTLRADVSALKRFQITVMSAFAVVGALATFFADAIREFLKQNA